MKSLKTLIKLHRKQMDELRRHMAELERQKEMMEYAVSKLGEELAYEMNTALAFPEMANFYGNYAQRIKNRQDIIRKEVHNINNSISKVSEEIAAGFSELKKYEIAYENMLKAQKEAENRKEQAVMDEIGIGQFIRKEEQSGS